MAPSLQPPPQQQQQQQQQPQMPPPPLPTSPTSAGPAPSSKTRYMRQRTMSDASARVDASLLGPALGSMRSGLPSPRLQQQQWQQKQKQQRARRSLHLESHDDQGDDEEDDDDDAAASRRYRTSAPLLNAYGIPKMRTRASMGALKYTAPATGTTSTNQGASWLPPSDLEQKIRVCVRKRPLNRKELDRGDKDIAPCIGTRTLNINEPKLKLDMTKYIEQHAFTFDDVFDIDEANETVYARTALPLVHYVFQGGKATCFAYGQTGSGKTYTMLDPQNGLYMMAAQDIFAMLREPEHQHLTAWIGLYEIYQGQLYDLLNARKKLFAREDGKRNVIIMGLKEYPIDNVDKLIQIFEYGNLVRSTGSTGANDSSSRSHAVLQILLKPKKNKKKIHGKLSFIDLAGSERGADRGEADTKTRMEGAEINKSLLALKECIRALDQEKSHTPFRQSKLTQVLKDSFVGQSRTCMIATISPSGSNSEHTLNTLRYADRVKELKGETNVQRSGSIGSIPDDRPSWRNSGHSSNYEMDDALMTMDSNDDDDDDDDDDLVLMDGDDDSDILNEDTYNVAVEENIFDVDFPHSPDDEVFHVPPPPQQHHQPQQQQQQQQQPMYDITNTTKHLSLSKIRPPPPMRRGSTLPTDQLPVASMDNLPNSPAVHGSNANAMTRSQSMHQQPMVSVARSSSFVHPHHHRGSLPLSPTTTSTTLSSTNSNMGASGAPMDYDAMDDFVRFHRAQIRSVSDDTKRESKLVATMSLQLSATADEDEKCQHHFQSYLASLDALLEEKMAAISALRDRVNDTMALLDDQ
ncbi:P-loop containing nucleoside triphosphate hydrolase protein [Gongronella butleri]|nr:P-loop containing nucleoside triphosphate hydrolase protein [Gongronella butleri]